MQDAPLLVVEKIVSGGQTGVDRAALDAAMQLGLAHGGWCPRGRKAEDGRIPECYRLSETDSAQYHIRTRKNVHESDATLILCRGPLAGGTELTRQLALQHGRPCLVVDLREPNAAAVKQWLAENSVKTLNVAGPRESQSPGIGGEARRFLGVVLGRVSE
jgi:hypothetical protein